MITSAKSVRIKICLILALVAQLVLGNTANATPSISPIADQNNNETQFVSITAAGFTDVAGATLSYSATGLPGGVSINSGSGLITGTLSYTSSGDHTVTVTVTENSTTPSSASTTFVWHVIDVNRAPFIVTQPAITIDENQRLSTTLIFADEDNDTLVTTDVQLPAFARITSTNSQPGALYVAIEALPTFTDAGEYNMIISATDGKSTPVTNSVHLTVRNVNQPPQITNPGPQTVQAGDAVSLQIAATDADQDVLTYGAQNLPAGLTIDPGTGLISGSVSLAAGPSYSSTITVADNLTQSQVTIAWTVTAATPVVSVLSPGDQTSGEGDTVNLPIAASSTDNGSLLYAANGLPVGLSIDTAGVISGNLDFDTAGDYLVTVTVQLQSDTTIEGTTSFNWHVNNTNRAPTASAGPDQNVITGETVSLDGSASSDPDNDMLTFSWRFASVPASSSITNANLSGAATPQATFIPDVDGAYTIDLEVSDGNMTAIDTVVITATTPPNVQPNADAGIDQQVEINTTVQLDGTASNDPDNYPQALGYHWYFSTLPAGSALTDNSILNADTELASFVPDVTGIYVLSLDVSDGQAQATDQMQVTATYTNVAPVADAGIDQSVVLGNTVQLDGTGSHDPDQYPDPLIYTWTMTSVPTGSAVTSASLTNANTANAGFIPDVAGTYLVRLDVSDGEASAFDQMTVTVQSVGEVPTPPSWIKIKCNKRSTYLLWKSATGAESYNVYRKTSNDADFILVAQANGNRFRDEIPYGTNAEYYVIAVNQYGMSEPSITVSTNTPSYRRRGH